MENMKKDYKRYKIDHKKAKYIVNIIFTGHCMSAEGVISIISMDINT